MGLLLGAGGAARAQNTAGEGPGVKLGESMLLHLGFGIDFAWDSNVFYTSTNPTNAFSMRLNPFFRLTTAPRQSQPKVQLDFHGGLNYVEYLTTNAELAKHRQFNVDAGVQAAFFATNPYNFVIFDNYVRSTQPPYSSTSSNLDRDTNEVGFRLNLSPGGGRLTIYIGYLFGIDYWEPALLRDYDLQYHRFDLRVSWRVLPKTAIYIATNETINQYPHPGTFDHPDSFPFRIEAGLQGLVTAKLTVNLWVGYGNGFYVQRATMMAAPPSPNTAIGGFSLTWKPTFLSTGQLGYQHDFQNSLLGAYYDQDTVYLSWTQLVWKFTGFLRLQYSNLRFKGVQMVQATTDGTDNFVGLNTRVDYPLVRGWLFGSAGYDLFFNKSDRMLATTTNGTPGVVPADYTRHVVYLRLTLSY
ncbi:MAG: hypothetical protein JWN44_3711 [Myxococcales bacterium]|nr:hypothetical protein [Myxococcales bacterium]